MSRFLTTLQVEEKSREVNPPKPIHLALGSLNENQLKAALANDQYIRLIAGPGTGKTHTIKCRIARLINDGVDPLSILAVAATIL